MGVKFPCIPCILPAFNESSQLSVNSYLLPIPYCATKPLPKLIPPPPAAPSLARVLNLHLSVFIQLYSNPTQPSPYAP